MRARFAPLLPFCWSPAFLPNRRRRRPWRSRRDLRPPPPPFNLLSLSHLTHSLWPGLASTGVGERSGGVGRSPATAPSLPHPLPACVWVYHWAGGRGTPLPLVRDPPRKERASALFLFLFFSFFSSSFILDNYRVTSIINTSLSTCHVNN